MGTLKKSLVRGLIRSHAIGIKRRGKRKRRRGEKKELTLGIPSKKTHPLDFTKLGIREKKTITRRKAESRGRTPLNIEKYTR